MNEIDRRANEGLQKLGYQQEMKRSRGLWHILFMSLAIMAVREQTYFPVAFTLKITAISRQLSHLRRRLQPV
ncbi:hypothetical protein L218DRAFT_960703 [Marasmius fiardii PR-910]|nr:hypothetical protein L218DRAFT_960703 [Marasmius fiardii PR-910]